MTSPGSPAGSGDIPDRADVAEIINRQGGTRDQILDDHNYRVTAGYGAATFRLQLFTASNRRPVAVATQAMGLGDGTSLINAGERIVEHVWRQHFLDEPLPPIWVQHQLLGPTERNLTLVIFNINGEGHISKPRWRTLSPEQLHQLTGRIVDLDRGDIEPAAAEPEPARRYEEADVAAAPPAQPFRVTDCMLTGTNKIRRLAWQLRPKRLRRGCCWYHGGDWRAVNLTALRLLREAQAVAETPEEVSDYITDTAEAEGVDGWELEALTSLLVDPISWHDDDPEQPADFVNGQHRIQAMRDARVPRTLVLRELEEQ